MALGIPASCIGLMVSGDVDGITIYTDRYGRKVAYPKSPPKEPPSARQVGCRNRFKMAQAQYTALSLAEKTAYEDLTKLANLALTGQNLLIHVAMRHAFGMLTTLMHQTGISVTPPNPV